MSSQKFAESDRQQCYAHNRSQIYDRSKVNAHYNKMADNEEEVVQKPAAWDTTSAPAEEAAQMSDDEQQAREQVKAMQRAGRELDQHRAVTPQEVSWTELLAEAIDAANIARQDNEENQEWVSYLVRMGILVDMDRGPMLGNCPHCFKVGLLGCVCSADNCRG